MGSRGKGSLQVGSTSMRALADACCPVLVVRGETDADHDGIVAAVDIDEPCEQVLDFAFTKASRRGARLRNSHLGRALDPGLRAG